MLVSITCRQVEGLKTIYVSATGNIYFAFENESKKNSACKRVSQAFLSRLGFIQLEKDQQSLEIFHDYNNEESIISYQSKLDLPLISNRELIKHIVNLMATKNPLRRVPIVELCGFS